MSNSHNYNNNGNNDHYTSKHDPQAKRTKENNNGEWTPAWKTTSSNSANQSYAEKLASHQEIVISRSNSLDRTSPTNTSSFFDISADSSYLIYSPVEEKSQQPTSRNASIATKITPNLPAEQWLQLIRRKGREEKLNKRRGINS